MFVSPRGAPDGRLTGWIAAAAVGLLLCAGCACVHKGAVSANAVEKVLDDWHDAASKADEARYLGHMAGDAVFLGTDAAERWGFDEFEAFVHPYFEKGKGWTYAPFDRHVMLSKDQSLAWFDEKLRSDHHGELRGTGVLRLVDGEWKIVQYNMVFTVPNGIAKQVVEIIRAADTSSK
jgi:ketosteroid isomerase-like protein